MSTVIGSDQTRIYIIDDDYRIVYFNAAVRERVPDIQSGDICYRKLCHNNIPCAGCPLAKERDQASLFYNAGTRKWLEMEAARIDWPGSGTCGLVLVNEIKEGNKNIFYDLTNIAAYVELFELNYTRDSYKILYHAEDTYMVPSAEGELSSMLKDAAEHLIYSEDAEAFRRFWTRDGILEIFRNKDNSNLLKGQFRKKRTDGTYGWAALILVPIQSSSQDEDIAMCFVQDIDDRMNGEAGQKVGQAVCEENYDPLTGLYRRTVYLRMAQKFLLTAGSGSYCLMTIDIEHFKLFNDWYGQEAGDMLLRSIGRCLRRIQESKGGISGYMGGDDFVIILPEDQDTLAGLQNQIVEYVKEFSGTAGFLPAFGIYRIEDRHLPVSKMYDRASMALDSVKGNYAHRVGYYDNRMKQKMEEDHRLLSDVQKALSNREFTFYAQPKCNMRTGKIVGLESLVRWNHPERGLINPAEFLPLLENNGLITNLDLYIWEEVCKSVRLWIDSGHRAIPISVNVSRVDIYTLDVADVMKKLVERYSLDPMLVEVEITESAYSEEYTIISALVESLRGAGFTVLMDDFGSGYSSLNMLKDVNVDVLKIDMKFLDMSQESMGKGVGILEAVTRMANIMGMRMIAEGVETREQIEFLLNMGCTYGQGYYFYHPMPIETFEPLLADESNVDFRGIKARQVDRIQMKEMLNEDMASDAILNNILGAVAFYDIHDNKLELLRVNEKYCSLTKMNGVDLEERSGSILDDVYKEDRNKTLQIFEAACANPFQGAEGDIRRYLGDGSIIWMHLRVFFLREQDGHRLFYGSISDISEQKKKEYQLESSQRALSSVVHISENDASFMKLAEENRRAAAAIFAQITPGGMIGGYCEEGFPLYFANHEMVKLLGYDSFEELSMAIDGKVENTIHPDDRKRVAEDIGGSYYAGLEYATIYRMPKKNGTWFWTMDKGRVIQAEDGRLAIVSACMDISEPMEKQQRLTERNNVLTRQNEELNFLTNDMPGGYHRCANNKDFDFIYISSRFLEIFGYTRNQIKELFDDKFVNMIHPDDRAKVTDGVGLLMNNQENCSMEYRMLSSHGYIWIIDQTRHIKFGDKEFFQGVVMDITDLARMRRSHELFATNAPMDVLIMNVKKGRTRYEVIAGGIAREMGRTDVEYQNILEMNGCMGSVKPGVGQTIERKMTYHADRGEDFRVVFPIEIPDKKKMLVCMDARFLHRAPEQEEYSYLLICSDVSSLERDMILEQAGDPA